MKQKTAVVLLNYDGQSWLERFLPKVLQYTPKEAVYVIDNASTDESLTYLRTCLEEERIISLPSNLGYTGGYNAGLRQLGHDYTYYVLLNSDVEVEADWLPPLVSFMEANPTAGACQPKVISYKSNEKGQKYFDYAGAAGGFLDPLGYPYCRGRVFSHTEADLGQYDEEISCDWASGACFIVRSKAFWQVGGFDPRFFMHMEEIDLCFRLHQAGYSVHCVTAAEVKHVGAATMPVGRKKTFFNIRNGLLMLCKNLSWQELCKILPLRLACDIIAIAYFCLQKQWASIQAFPLAYVSFFKLLFVKVPSFSKVRTITPKHPRTYVLYAYFVKKQRTYAQIAKK